jgi:hypothetical protein
MDAAQDVGVNYAYARSILQAGYPLRPSRADRSGIQEPKDS